LEDKAKQGKKYKANNSRQGKVWLARQSMARQSTAKKGKAG
jgi:hypothetical protein